MEVMKQVFDPVFEMLKEPWVLDLWLALVGIIFFVKVLRMFARFFERSVRPSSSEFKTVSAPAPDPSPDPVQTGCGFVCSDSTCTWFENPAGAKWCEGCNRRGLCSFCSADCSKRSKK